MRPNIPYCIDSIRKNLTNGTAILQLEMLEAEFTRLQDVIDSLIRDRVLSDRSKN